ncbi:TPA: hypothetical protein HA246_07630 [Candidatus Woesearchaeota archaeon]|nr:hypothetical protein [Candidatus Woesearchaeota archaeon]
MGRIRNISLGVLAACLLTGASYSVKAGVENPGRVKRAVYEQLYSTQLRWPWANSTEKLMAFEKLYHVLINRDPYSSATLDKMLPYGRLGTVRNKQFIETKKREMHVSLSFAFGQNEDLEIRMTALDKLYNAMDYGIDHEAVDNCLEKLFGILDRTQYNLVLINKIYDLLSDTIANKAFGGDTEASMHGRNRKIYGRLLDDAANETFDDKRRILAAAIYARITAYDIEKTELIEALVKRVEDTRNGSKILRNAGIKE